MIQTEVNLTKNRISSLGAIKTLSKRLDIKIENYINNNVLELDGLINEMQGKVDPMFLNQLESCLNKR